MPAAARHVFTDIGHGDLRVSGPIAELEMRRAGIHPAPWTWLEQVHGSEVVVVDGAGDGAGTSADAIVTTALDAPIAVHTADCAPVLLTGPGTIAVVHAGWRGLTAGVIEAAAEAMVAVGSAPTAAVLGPCIRSRCYEFEDVAVSPLVDRYGTRVIAETGWGTPALDIAAAVLAACEGLGVGLEDVGTCTACSPVHRSHRARAEPERQALVAWLVGDEPPSVVQGSTGAER